MQALKIQRIKMQAWLMQCLFSSSSAIQQAFLFQNIWHYFTSIGPDPIATGAERVSINQSQQS